MKGIVENIRKDRIVYVDVGARWGIPRPWKDFLDVVTVIGFEPDAIECNRLNARAQNEGLPVKYLPNALYNRREDVVLNITRNPGCSSLLKPNRDILEEFPEPERFDITNTVTLNGDTLDSVLEQNRVADVDFLKIDTQGTELDILRGAERTLSKHVFGIEIEAEFVELYKGQALFADIDTFLRGKGFILFDLNRHRWKRRNVPANMPCRGQIVFCEALYLRAASAGYLSRIEKIQGLKLIFIAALLGYYDYGRTINNKLLDCGKITEKEKNIIETWLYMEPLTGTQKAICLLKTVIKQIMRPRGIEYRWYSSDGSDVDLFATALRRKVNKFLHEEG